MNDLRNICLLWLDVIILFFHIAGVIGGSSKLISMNTFAFPKKAPCSWAYSLNRIKNGRQEWGSCWRSSSVRRLSKFSLEIFCDWKTALASEMSIHKTILELNGRERGRERNIPLGFRSAHLSWCEGICFQPPFSKRCVIFHLQFPWEFMKEHKISWPMLGCPTKLVNG